MLKSILSNSPDFREQGKFWTDALSLVEGCTPVSPGCANCWLSALEGRVGARAVPGASSIPSPLAPGGVFNGTVRFRTDRLDIPLRARKPRVYAIWSDLFHSGVDDEFRACALQVIHKADHHQFIAITKRPEVAVRFLASYPLVLPNLTVLVSMEDQLRADERFPSAMAMVDLGWRVGALCEPLLGPISFRWAEGWPGNVVHTAQQPDGPTDHLDALRRLSWVITGGESGHKARPAHPAWFRALRDQAVEAGVPFVFKQWGEWLSLDDIDQSNPAHLGCLRVSSVGSLSASGIYRRENCVLDSDEVFVAKVGKKKAGHSLDGREWLEVP